MTKQEEMRQQKAFCKQNQSSKQLYVPTQLEHKTPKLSLQNPTRTQPPNNTTEQDLN